MRRQPVTVPLLLVALLPWLAAGAVEGQSDGVDGPGEAAPWSVEGTPTPASRPESPYRGRGRDDDDFWERLEKSKKELRLRCQVLEVEELGRIYVQDRSGAGPYWIQLPPEVKIRTSYPNSFDGRKKLTVDDLKVGQRLVVKLRDGTDEIVKVVVTPVKA